MITIYHNPHCSKSRSTCELIASTLNAADEPIEIVEYLTHPLTATRLKELATMVDCGPRGLLRETEAEYKDLRLADLALTDDQIYQAIAEHPILMQRPIVVRDGRAVIGRPPENVKALFD